MKRIVIIGATSSIAERCARLWAKESADLTLVGRNQLKLNRIKQDLEIRSPGASIATRIINFTEPKTIELLIHEFSEIPIDIVLIAHGNLPEQKKCQINLAENKDALEINAISPVLFAEGFVKILERNNYGTLAIIGSVAGDRGRKSNYIYGAAKGLITRYAQGLQHRFARTSVKIVLIKPGPTDTPMTAELKKTGANMSKPDDVAKRIVAGIAQGKKTIYAPRKWAIIMAIIIHIPSIIFNKLEI